MTKSIARSVVISTLLVCTTLWLPGSVASADSVKEAPNQSERSPEEAAGGKQNLQRIQKACEEDVKKLCPEIRPGGGRILQCLHGQESNLTPACRQVLGPRSSNP
ncbi:MAG TPA: cysteine rich repeat-containing protein [Nitrospira sp.]|nr:cysteine rich repeat-containing protein [Nitrospira sp.]